MTVRGVWNSVFFNEKSIPDRSILCFPLLSDVGVFYHIVNKPHNNRQYMQLNDYWYWWDFPRFEEISGAWASFVDEPIPNTYIQYRETVLLHQHGAYTVSNSSYAQKHGPEEFQHWMLIPRAPRYHKAEAKREEFVESDHYHHWHWQIGFNRGIGVAVENMEQGLTLEQIREKFKQCWDAEGNIEQLDGNRFRFDGEA